MNRERLTAFTDGVLAVIITIMVLEMHPPRGADIGALLAVWPTFASYVLSFIYIGIDWSNHHHFFTLVRTVNGAILWANLHLLFWLSVVPFTTAWMGEHPLDPWPTAIYGSSLLAASIAFWILTAAIIAHQGPQSQLKAALGNDLKGKISPALYVAGVALAFVDTRAAQACYLIVALIWLIPDRRVERRLRAVNPAG